MKSVIALLIALLLVIGLTACADKNLPESSVQFYYCTSNISFDGINGVIAPEARPDEKTDDLLSMLNTYLQGPISDVMENPFPSGTKAISVSSEASTICVTLNQQFAQLTELDLTLACACLSKTLLDITQLQTIQIQCEDALLGGNPAITLCADDLVWIETAQTQAEPES